jgi:hypothetical protein
MIDSVSRVYDENKRNKQELYHDLFQSEAVLMS